MKIKDIVTIGIIILCFIAISVHKIELPGLYEDEAFNAVPALEILQGRIFLPEAHSLKIIGKNFPVMITPFSGAFDAYVLIPLIYIFGLCVKTIRISQVFFAAFGIFLTYILCKRLFSRKVAVISAFLLAINPTFILLNRQGLMVSSINLPIMLVAILMMFLWYAKGKNAYLYSSFFILGIPLFNRANFFWPVLALLVSAFFVYKKEIMLLIKQRKLKTDSLIVYCFYFFLLGAGLFVYNNIQTGTAIKALIDGIRPHSKDMGLFWYFKDLLKNIELLTFMLSAANNAGSFGYSDGIINHAYPLLFLVSMVLTPFLLLKRREIGILKKFFFLGLTVIFILLQTPFSLKDASAYNLYVLYPFVQVIIAVFLLEFYYFLKNTNSIFYLMCVFLALMALIIFFNIVGYLYWIVGVIFLALNLYFLVRKKGAKYFLTVFAGLLIFLELGIIFQYYKAVSKNGGVGHFSDAIYELSDFLKENKVSKPIAMDWGFRNRLLILTNGKVNCKAFYSERIRNNKYFSRMCEKLLERPQNLYLVNVPDLDVRGTWPLFKEIAGSKGIIFREIKIFNQKDGRKIFSLYKQNKEYDFIDNFSKALIKNKGPEEVCIKDFAIKGEVKKVIFAHPLSEISYSMEIPVRAVLKFSIGIAENSWNKGDGTMGEIYIKSGDRETKVFSKFLDPNHRLEDRRWHDYEIELSEFSGRNIGIIFKTFPGPVVQEEGDYEADWWGWGGVILAGRY